MDIQYSANEKFDCFTMDQFPRDDTWYLASPSEIEECVEIERATGGEIVGDHLHVGVGVVSGKDKAFLMTNEEFEELSENEKKYVTRFIKAKNCKRYEIEGNTLYIFVDSIKSEDDLKSLPNIYERLNAHKVELEARYGIAKKNWWEWATIRNMDLFKENLDKPKIFLPCRDRSLVARYSYTNQRVFGSGDVLMIVGREELREDLRFILAWLNSEFINKWYSIKGSNSGHRKLYTQSYVSKIPIRLINWEEKYEVDLHDKIVNEVQRAIDEGDQPLLEGLIEKLVKPPTPPKTICRRLKYWIMAGIIYAFATIRDITPNFL